ncbi:MAG: nuclease-related domain-containing protein [Defluviicoccus sp.]|nr:nuclease-related domain-containing protein [Defluviicoccus sp.]MDE0383131.1 nuclease-related domain-containing protein [Defluviicoccus sp.]
MIAKPYQHKADQSDRRLRAGAAAERRVAYHLQCCFEDHPEVHVLHDLRIEDPEQPQPDGSPGAFRFDHLVVHRRGMFLIESRSVAGEVTIRSDGSGGHKWVRLYGGRETEMPCPIERAETRAEFLRGFLERRREELVGKLPFGSRTVAKIVDGTDRLGFRHAPLQLVFAVSDYGIIEKIDGRKRPGQAFPPVVGKADTIPDRVCREIARHRKGSGILCVGRGRAYGGWRMAGEDAAGVAGFLAALTADDPAAPPARCDEPVDDDIPRRSGAGHGDGARADEAACRHCDGRELAAGSGDYGYFWICDSCGRNTLMPLVCSACGAKGRRNAKVRIRNERDAYLRDCRECGLSETVWTVA